MSSKSRRRSGSQSKTPKRFLTEEEKQEQEREREQKRQQMLESEQELMRVLRRNDKRSSIKSKVLHISWFLERRRAYMALCESTAEIETWYQQRLQNDEELTQDEEIPSSVLELFSSATKAEEGFVDKICWP
jgi:inorganic pyrophosphatase/exopolyphosphatase